MKREKGWSKWQNMEDSKKENTVEETAMKIGICISDKKIMKREKYQK